MSIIKDIRICNDRKDISHTDGGLYVESGYVESGYIENDEVPVWRGSNPYCITDAYGNTGYVGFRNLVLVNSETGIGLGVVIDNNPSNPEYIPPYNDTGICPIAQWVEVTPNRFDVDHREQEVQISITSNSSWSINPLFPGVSFSQTSGNGDQTVTVFIDENTEEQNKSKSFVVSSNDSDVTIVVNQEAFDTSFLDVSPRTINFDVIGGVETITVDSPSPWDYSTSAMGWASVTRSGDTLTVNAPPNETAPKTGNIIIEGVASNVVVTVNQEADTIYPVQMYGRTQYVGQFDGADNPDDAMNNPTLRTVYATSEEDDIGIGTRFYLDNNYTILAGNEKWYRISDTTKVVQIDNGGYFLQMVDTSIVLSVSPSNMNIEGDGDTRTINVTSNSNWTVQNIPSWVTINGASSGSGNGSISITIAPYTGSGSRSGTVTIRTSDNLRFATTTITQAAVGILEISPTSWVAPSSSGGSFVLEIDTAVNWNIQLLPPTIGFSVSQSSGSGDALVSVYVPPNESGSAILLTVEVQAGASVKFCNITVPG